MMDKMVEPDDVNFKKTDMRADSLYARWVENIDQEALSERHRTLLLVVPFLARSTCKGSQVILAPVSPGYDHVDLTVRGEQIAILNLYLSVQSIAYQLKQNDVNIAPYAKNCYRLTIEDLVMNICLEDSANP